MTREREVHVAKGWVMLPVVIAVFAIGVGLEVWFGFSVRQAVASRGLPNFWLLGSGLLVLGCGLFLCFGFFTLQPNEGRVLVLFGAYRGTIRTTGWRWTKPL